MPDFTVLYAEFSDLRRRVEALEGATYGYTVPVLSDVSLIRFYIEAHKALKSLTLLDTATWARQAYLLDVKALVRLGRLLNDPWPFRPFLRLLNHCVAIDNETAAARDHLNSVAQELLIAEGLELLEPADVLRSSGLEEAVARVQLRISVI